MRTTIFLILTLLVFAACTTEQAPEQQQEVEDETIEPIKIGFLGPMTGDVSVWGAPAAKAVELAAKEINEAGGVNGVPIKIIYEDDKCTSKEGVNGMTKLVNVDKVEAVIGTLCSAVAMPSYPIAEQAGVFMMAYGASSPSLSENTPLFFRTFPSDALQAKVAGELTIEGGYNKVAIFHINDDYGTPFMQNYKAKIEELGGEIVVIEKHLLTDTDFRVQLQKIKAAEPDVIFLPAFAKSAGLIAKQAREMGIEIPIRGGEALNDPSLIEIGGTATEGIKFTWPMTGSGDIHNNYLAAYEALHDEEPAAFTAEAYDALKLVVKSMNDCGMGGKTIKNCLENMESYEGASGVIIFDEYGDVLKEYTLSEVKDGKIVHSS